MATLDHTLNWDVLTDESVHHLQALLRIDTTAQEGPAVQYLCEQLAAEAGIEIRILEPGSGRPNLWARLRGSGKQRPLLLLSHLDVVPVERPYWSVDPFGGEIHDGYIYGRGAVDMKDMTAKQLTLLLHFARQAQATGTELDRDLVLLAVADEECMSEFGMAWIIKHAPELLDAEFALNEGGGYAFQCGSHRVYVCETAQKGSAQVTLRAVGKPGHGAFPHAENAVARLSRAIYRLSAASLPLHVTPTVQRFVDKLALNQSRSKQLLFRQALHPLSSGMALNMLSEDEITHVLRAVLHNTVSPTLLRGGDTLNVIPSEAFAHLDGRIVPGQTAQSFLREIQQRIADPNVEVDVDLNSSGYECQSDTAMFAALEDAIAQHDPGAIVAPYMFPAVSDSRFLAPLGIIPYGFDPMKPEPGCPLPQQLAHNHDERISLANMGFGLRVLHDTILQLSC